METLISKDGNNKLVIENDDYPESPREWDNLGTMICFHGRYDLGDKHNLSVKEAIALSERKDVICLPLHLYDHSGITMNTTGFSCPWDSGKVGFIYVTLKHAREEMGWKLINEARRNRIIEILKSEVNTYDQYLTGEVYRFTLYEKQYDDWNQIDSCSGFYGSDHKNSGLFEYADWNN